MPSKDEQLTVLDGFGRFRTLFEQFRSGAVGSAPCNEEHRTGLYAVERFRTLFEQVAVDHAERPASGVWRLRQRWARSALRSL